MLIAFHKPYGVLCRFTAEPGSVHRTLAAFGLPKKLYPVGRLDADSEGLLLLTDEPEWNARLLRPGRGHARVYWSQVEGVPHREDLRKLEPGILLRGRKTLPCKAWVLDPQPDLPPRDPPVRRRENIPTCWIALRLWEGKNRQARRMTAAIGFPTLRLIRVRIGGFSLAPLAAGGMEGTILRGAEAAGLNCR